MKILVVIDFPSHPTNAGNRSCVVSYVDMLRSEGHRVDILCSRSPFDLEGWAEGELEASRSAWEDSFHLHEFDRFDRIVWRIRSRWSRILGRGTGLDDLCVPSLVRMVGKMVRENGYQAVILNYWHLSRIFVGLKGVSRILFTHDRFAGRYERTGNRWLSTTARIEGLALDRADAVLSIQDEETALFRSQTRTPVLTAYTPFEIRDLGPSRSRNLLLLAGPNPDNIKGLRWFVDAVLPLLRSSDPSVRLLVGGRIHVAIPDLKGREGVDIVGDIASLGDFYARGDICINPNFTGTGLKIKTFEALAHGRAMVCHRHCLDGVFDSSNAPMIGIDSAEGFAAALSDLIGDPERLSGLREASRDYVERMNATVQNSFEMALRIVPAEAR